MIEIKIFVSRRRAAQDVWFGWIVIKLYLDNDGKHQSKILRSRGQYLLVGKDCKEQAGQNGLDVTKFARLGYIFIVNGLESEKLRSPRCHSTMCSIPWMT